jgi:uncharacterized protein YbjT (DUF2867 family)
VRDPSRVAPHPNVECVKFELDDETTYERALSDTGLLALITPADPRQTERELALLDAAKRSGVQRILNLSVLGADLPSPISAFARWQVPVEKALERGSILYVTLRPNAFMQNMLLQAAPIEAGQFVEPSGNQASSVIDVGDIARVAVGVSAGGFDGRALDLSGPEALTGFEIARVLSVALGRSIRFISPPLAAFRTALLDRGAPTWRVDALTELYEAVQEGRAPHLARITHDVELVTGRPPRALHDFVVEHFASILRPSGRSD